MLSNVLQKEITEYARDFEFLNQLKNSSVLVTGATGLIGSTIVRFLDFLNANYSANIKIYATARDKQKAKNILPSARWLIADITKPIKLKAKVDYIIHTACPTQSKYFIEHPVDVIDASVLGTKNVLEFARRADAKSVVYLSSLEVYGEHSGDSKITEDDYGHVNQMSVRSCYPEAKRLCETMCVSYYKQYGTPVKVVRLTQTFGPGVDKNDNRVFMQFAKKALCGQNIELHTNGTQARNYLYILDSVTAIFVALIKGENGQAYNAANKDAYISAKDMAQFVAHKFGNNIKVEINPKQNMGYAPETQTNLDCSKLIALGWQPKRNLEYMFSSLMQYLKE